jgi:putative membrane protein
LPADIRRQNNGGEDAPCRNCGRLCVGLMSVPAQAEDVKPNDGQIAHIAYTAGQIDIKAAQLALQKSKNKEVRDFAENMVHDHTAVNDQALALVKKLNVTPEDNDTSKALVKQAQAKRA